MIDIHCHILPGVDDGPPDMETSIRMLKVAAGDGISHIVASPHFPFKGGHSHEDIRIVLEVLKERAMQEGITVRLYLGADARLSIELIELIGMKEIPTISNSRYFLLELPEVIPPNVERFLFDVRAKGFLPVITHPERNYGLLSRPERVTAFRETGALYQLTAMSITGGFDDRILWFSRFLLKKGVVDFVATDAHDPDWRRPVLSRAYGEVLRMCGEREARRLFFENPLAVLEDRQIDTPS